MLRIRKKGVPGGGFRRGFTVGGRGNSGAGFWCIRAGKIFRKFFGGGNYFREKFCAGPLNYFCWWVDPSLFIFEEAYKK